GALLGTPAYMAPEQAGGEPAGERSDIYSLTVLFHELLGLEHYLGDCDSLAAVLTGAIARVPPPLFLASHPHQPAVPADLAHFVRHGMAKTPAERFQTVSEMIDRLRGRQNSTLHVECPVTFAREGINTAGRFVDRHPTFTFVVVGVVMPLSFLLALVY